MPSRANTSPSSAPEASVPLTARPIVLRPTFRRLPRPNQPADGGTTDRGPQRPQSG